MSKKLYIYDDVEGLTDSWHDGGGLVIITSLTPEEALAAAPDHIYIKRDPLPKLGTPDRIVEVSELNEDAIHVFPNEGCC